MRLRLYIATSLDGYIADEAGGVDWLHPYEGADLGFHEFLSGIHRLVMGRKTYEQTLGFGPWPYSDHPVHVMTSRPLEEAPRGVEPWRADAAALLERLKATSGGDVWLVGGSQTVRAFLEIDAIDRFEITVVPRLLGRGIPLFAQGVAPKALRLVQQQALPRGLITLTYERGGAT